MPVKPELPLAGRSYMVWTSLSSTWFCLCVHPICRTGQTMATGTDVAAGTIGPN